MLRVECSNVSVMKAVRFEMQIANTFALFMQKKQNVQLNFLFSLKGWI
jgi:hypothetical protein